MAEPTPSEPVPQHRRPATPPPAPPPPRPDGTPPTPSGQGPGGAPTRFRPPGGAAFWWVLVALLAINFFVVSLIPDRESRLTVPYTTFRAQVEASNVSEVTSKGDTIQGTFKKAVTYPPGKDGKSNTLFQTQRPAFGDDSLLQLMISKGVTVNAKPVDEGRSLLATILLSFGPTILLVALFIWLMRRASSLGGGGGVLGTFGRSRAKRYEGSGDRVTFDDVAGIDEAEDELVEVVDFLRHPERYRRLGGQIPRGVLLSGPPGTGKPLLAKAVAGEANVPFFSNSASEFVEAIVGVGASRVRDLFAQAKAAAPSIVFIDELDAIGRARAGGNVLGGNDEREQTLNQILTEMDGFSGTEGVIVIGATNRAEILDPALLRPGRFDRRVVVNPPDQRGRKAILEVHVRGVPLADDVDLNAIASSTPGMVGADLKLVVNEASLTAARRSHERVTQSDFTDSLEKILLGAERRIVLSPEERERTAFHESGHALLGMLLPGADPVRKVSIVPRGRALGVTFQAPETDRYGYGTVYLRGRITGALGGRAAEEIVYGEVTTGAESDLEQVTSIARQMVGRWGMSDAIGPVSVLPGPNDQPTFPGADGAAEQTRETIDAEVRRLVEASYEEAVSMLRANRERLDALAHALLEHETLDEADAYRIAGIPRRPAETPALTP